MFATTAFLTGICQYRTCRHDGMHQVLQVKDSEPDRVPRTMPRQPKASSPMNASPWSHIAEEKHLPIGKARPSPLLARILTCRKLHKRTNPGRLQTFHARASPLAFTHLKQACAAPRTFEAVVSSKRETLNLGLQAPCVLVTAWPQACYGSSQSICLPQRLALRRSQALPEDRARNAQHTLSNVIEASPLRRPTAELPHYLRRLKTIPTSVICWRLFSSTE